MKKPFFKTFVGNLLIIALLCIALYWIFFGSLSIITRHNDVVTVPDLKNKSVKQAIKLVENAGLDYIIDSVYLKTERPLIVLDQQPEKGATVKSGRQVIITVNKASAPLIDMPNLVNQTFRSALLTLRRLGLEMGDTTFMYDISENTIMNQKINGRDIPYGTKIPLGTRIDLVVSAGLSDIQVNVPDAIGLTYREAIALIKENGLQYVVAFDDKIKDTATAKVYAQLPESRNDYGEPYRVFQGEMIDLRVKQDPKIVRKKYIRRPDPVDWNTSPDTGYSSGSTPSTNNQNPANNQNTRPKSNVLENEPPANNNQNPPEALPEEFQPKHQLEPENPNKKKRPESNIN